MKKIISLLLLVLATNFVSAKNDTIWLSENWDILANKEHAEYYRFVTKIKKSDLYEIKGYYLDGTLQSIGTTKNTQEPFIKHGKVTWFYRSGEKKVSINYEENIPVGTYVLFYPNGEILEQYSFLDMGSTTPAFLYFPNGQIKKELTYDLTKDIKTSKVYDFNKILTEQVIIADGYFDGHLFKLNAKGDTIYNGIFKDRNPISYQMNYNKYRQVCKFENGQENWKLYKYDVLYKTFSYRNDYLIGDYITYFPNGKIKEKSSYDEACRAPEITELTPELPERFIYPFLYAHAQKNDINYGLNGEHVIYNNLHQLMQKDVYECGQLIASEKFDLPVEEVTLYTGDDQPIIMEEDPLVLLKIDNSKNGNLKNGNCEIINTAYNTAHCENTYQGITISIFTSDDYEELSLLKNNYELDTTELVLFLHNKETKSSSYYLEQKKELLISDCLNIAIQKNVYSSSDISDYISDEFFKTPFFNNLRLPNLIKDSLKEL